MFQFMVHSVREQHVSQLHLTQSQLSSSEELKWYFKHNKFSTEHQNIHRNCSKHHQCIAHIPALDPYAQYVPNIHILANIWLNKQFHFVIHSVSCLFLSLCIASFFWGGEIISVEHTQIQTQIRQWRGGSLLYSRGLRSICGSFDAFWAVKLMEEKPKESADILS